MISILFYRSYSGYKSSCNNLGGINRCIGRIWRDFYRISNSFRSLIGYISVFQARKPI
jgi:hypothetical protein